MFRTNVITNIFMSLIMESLVLFIACVNMVDCFAGCGVNNIVFFRGLGSCFD